MMFDQFRAAALVAFVAALSACSKAPDAPASAGQKEPAKATEKKNPKHVVFVQSLVFDDLASALNGHDAMSSRERALKIFNISQTVEAKTLASDYNANEVSADQKYKKKGASILVSGTVSGISKDFKGDPYVSLKGPGMFQDVQAQFGSNDLAALAALKKGMKVKFVCEVGTKIVTQVMLRGCSTVDAHTHAMREAIGKSAIDVIDGRNKASKDGAELIAFAYLIATSLPDDSPCFTEVSTACQKSLEKSMKQTITPEFKQKHADLVQKWSEN